MEQSLVEESKVHHQSVFLPRKAVLLPKCQKCTVGCVVSLLKEQMNGVFLVSVIAAHTTTTGSGFWH